MAVYRHRQDGVMPIASGGWKGVFFCCFGKKSDDSKEMNNAANHYGSTDKSKDVKKDGKKDGKKEGKKGSAYAYEEQDTSSDSDDEDLKRFKQAENCRRSGSVRSGDVEKAADPEADSKSGQQFDNQAYQVDSPNIAGSTEVRIDLDLDRHSTSSARDAVDAASSIGPSDSASQAKGPNTKGGSMKEEVIGANKANTDQTIPSINPPTIVDTKSALAAKLMNYRKRSIDCTTVSLKSGGTESLYGDEEEHLFDVSDLQHDPDAQLISKCGQLEVTFNYQQEQCKMNITVNHCKDIPTKDRGGANSTQIRMLLLPTKKQRHKTKIKVGEHPVFEESFVFKVPPEKIKKAEGDDAVGEMGVRFRLYGCERMRRERMIGESVVGFASLNLDTPTTHLLTLEPRANISPPKQKVNGIAHGDSKLDVSSLSRSDSASSTQSMQHGGMPELLIGLAYNGTTGRLSTEVIKGSNFRNMAMQRAPDTYVKLTMMSANGQEIARSKTSIRRGQPNPLYKETFMFQVALFQLPDVTLMVSVYNKRSMKRKEMIGWFSSGLNSSGEEELSHWKDMVDSKGEQVCRWHVLLEA